MSMQLEATRVLTQVAQVEGTGLAPWESAVLGFVIVMTALIGIWVMTSLVGTYFTKTASASKKSEAAPKAAPAAPAAKPVAAAPADDIPLAVIVAAAAWAVGGQVRNVTVNVSGRDSVTWTSQGRQSIYASHSTKAVAPVSTIGTIRQK